MNRKRLDRAPYEKLRAFVLKRDGMRCQVCGSMQHLEVHHLEFRSRGGEDDPDNLIVLCSRCHQRLHDGKLEQAV